MMRPWPQARPGAGEPASGKTRSARSAQGVKLKDWLALRRHTRRERTQCQQMERSAVAWCGDENARCCEREPVTWRSSSWLGVVHTASSPPSGRGETQQAACMGVACMQRERSAAPPCAARIRHAQHACPSHRMPYAIQEEHHRCRIGTPPPSSPPLPRPSSPRPSSPRPSPQTQSPPPQPIRPSMNATPRRRQLFAPDEPWWAARKRPTATNKTEGRRQCVGDERSSESSDGAMPSWLGLAHDSDSDSDAPPSTQAPRFTGALP